jgi:hypothetical protein
LTPFLLLISNQRHFKISKNINFLKDITIKNITKVVELDAALIGITNEGKEKHCLKLLDKSIDAILTSQQTHTHKRGCRFGSRHQTDSNLEFTVY